MTERNLLFARRRSARFQLVYNMNKNSVKCGCCRRVCCVCCVQPRSRALGAARRRRPFLSPLLYLRLARMAAYSAAPVGRSQRWRGTPPIFLNFLSSTRLALN